MSKPASRMKTLLIIFTCGVVCQHLLAQALITGTFGSPLTPEVTSGYAFAFDKDMVVSAVGIYDSSGNGLTGTNTLGVWTGNGSLLASTVFDSSTSPTLTNHFRWLPLNTPLVLSANTPYWVGTFGPEQGLQGTVGSGVVSSDTTFIAQVESSTASFTFPNSFTNRTYGMAYIGPNLQYTEIPALQATMIPTGQLLLSWPTNAQGYISESTPVLPSANWDSVTNPVVIVSNEFEVEIDATNAQGFYRLRLQ